MPSLFTAHGHQQSKYCLNIIGWSMSSMWMISTNCIDHEDTFFFSWYMQHDQEPLEKQLQPLTLPLKSMAVRPLKTFLSIRSLAICAWMQIPTQTLFLCWCSLSVFVDEIHGSSFLLHCIIEGTRYVNEYRGKISSRTGDTYGHQFITGWFNFISTFRDKLMSTHLHNKRKPIQLLRINSTAWNIKSGFI